MTYFMDLKRDDGTPVEVEFQYKPGSPDSWMEPGDPPEVNIMSAWLKDDNAVEVVWTDAEAERWEQEICASFEYSPSEEDFI